MLEKQRARVGTTKALVADYILEQDGARDAGEAGKPVSHDGGAPAKDAPHQVPRKFVRTPLN